MNLLTSVHTEASVTQNTMPLKTAEPAGGKTGGRFRDYLDETGTDALQKTESKPAPQKAQKECREKKKDEIKNTDDKSVASDNTLTAASTSKETCSTPGDKNADTTDGDADVTASSRQAGQENDNAVLEAGAAALSGIPLQHPEEEKHKESSAEISDPSKTDPGNIPVKTKKKTMAMTGKTIQDGTNQKSGSLSSPENTAGVYTVTDENAPVQNGPQVSARPVMPDTVQVAATESKVSANKPQASGRPVIPDAVLTGATESKVSANASIQQSDGNADLNLDGKSGDLGKVSSELPGAGLTDNQEAGVRGPGSGYSRVDRTENATTAQVAETVLLATPKTKEPDMSFVQKGEAADFNSQGKPADKTQSGHNNNTTAATANTAELPDGNRSQPDKDFMQSVKLEQAVPGKEIIVEHDQNDIKKNQTETAYQTNEKSGELFSLQDSNATASNGLKVVHQKAETADISQVSRENFVITRKETTSIELTIEPEGIGKLNIHLSLDKGAIHARINASENIGRDFIDRNMNNILQTLSDEGINIGSFSINLRDRKNEFMDEEKERKPYRGPAIDSPLPVLHTGNSTVNIFV